MGDRKRRVSPRQAVRLDVAARHGEAALFGSILDLSTMGTFFRPDATLSKGQFAQLLELPDLSISDRLHLDIHYHPARITVPAIVRWIGHNRSKGCYGLGLEFAGQLPFVLTDGT